MIDLDALFISNTPLIDVRAPVEFLRGHFPCSTNLPLLNDEERAEIGTCYKESGQAAAIALGHERVSGRVKETRLKAWLQFLRAHPEAKLYCARGGLRSQISTEWISQAGETVVRAPGGYQALRTHLLKRLQERCEAQKFLIVAGKTGSGKTAFLQASKNPSLDLEKLANHRGSSFGECGPQPAQATFENSIAVELIRHQTAPRILLEDESIMIGARCIPQVLFERMRTSPLILLEESLESRTRTLALDYVLPRLQAPEGSALHAFQFFSKNLMRIQKKIGGLRFTEILGLMKQAFDAHDPHLPEIHFEWIQALLQTYYDPLYERSIEKAKDRILHRGSKFELAQFNPNF